MRLHKSLILIGTVSLMALCGVAVSPALADNTHNYRTNGVKNIAQTQEVHGKPESHQKKIGGKTKTVKHHKTVAKIHRNKHVTKTHN